MSTVQVRPASVILVACSLVALVSLQCVGDIDQTRRKSPDVTAPELDEGIKQVVDMNEEEDAPRSDLEESEEEDVEITLKPLARDLEQGKRTLLQFDVRDADGELIDPMGLTWELSDDRIAEVTGGGLLRGLEPGETTLTASLGSSRSNAIDVRVVPAAPVDAGSVEILSRLPMLSVGDSTALEARVRAVDGRVLERAELTWHTSNPSAISLHEETGELKALAVGEAELWAESEGVESSRIRVRVSDASEYLSIQVEPRGVRATRELALKATFRLLAPGLTESFGTPTQPPTIDVVDERDDVLATLKQWSTFGTIEEVVDVSSLDEGEQSLRLRATLEGGTIIHSHVLRLWKTSEVGEEDGLWDELAGGETLGSETAMPVSIDGVTYLLGIACGRECNGPTLYYEEDRQRWSKLNYKRSEWVVRDGMLQEQTKDVNTFHLPRYQGWGWPSSDVREFSIPRNAHEKLLITSSNRDAFNDFNQEVEPERYWFDCHLMEWSEGAGLDGQGGYELLSSEAQFRSYLYDFPHPDELAMMAGGGQRHPPGVNAERLEECNSPKVIARADGQHVVAFLSRDMLSSDVSLHVRRWNGSTYEDLGPAHHFEAGDSALYDFALDGAGAPVLAYGQDGEDIVLRLSGSDRWEVLELASALSIRQVYLSGDRLFAAGVAHGDMRLYEISGGDILPLGGPLDARLSLDVSEPMLTGRDGHLVATWVEGAQQGRDVYAAVVLSGASSWTLVDPNPIDHTADQESHTPHIWLDETGQLLLSHTQNTWPLKQRVRRTKESILSAPSPSENGM